MTMRHLYGAGPGDIAAYDTDRLRAEFLVDAKSYTKIQGLPFRAAEIETEILKRL